MTPEVLQPQPLLYVPKQVITVFSTNPAGTGDSDTKYYLEISDIMIDKGKTVQSASRPLTRESLQRVMEVLSSGDKTTFHAVNSVVPTSLILIDQRAGKQMIAWWKPACRQPVIMQGKKSMLLWVPPLVYVVNGNKLAVGALQKNKKPTLVSKLFHAPFYNVYKDLKVCLGSVKPPKGTGDIQEMIESWEKCFWNSEFTTSVTGAYQHKDLKRWWRSRRRGRFPVKKLKGTTLTLGQLCKNV